MIRPHPFLPPLGRELVLASQSPRRADILRAQQLEFEILPSDISEEMLSGECLMDFLQRIAREKAESSAALRPEAVCLGFDTLVVLGDEILGKPESPGRAEQMLATLSGQTHQVYSSTALICRELGHCQVRYRCTRVRFRNLSQREIHDYVLTGEPMDKAGAYGIQGWGALMVESIEGCYFSVMGLSLDCLRELWLEFHHRHRAAKG